MTKGTGTATDTGTDTGWASPTWIESLLSEAAARGDGDGVLDALARGRLRLLTARLHADTPGHTAALPSQRDPATGRTCVPVLTSGMVPPWHPEWVFRRTSLAELAHRWPHDKRWLGVNLGTPYATVVDARPARRKAWPAAESRSGGPPAGLLLTHGGGPTHGPVAHGLAVGAHLAVHNSLFWNQLGAAYLDYETDIARLRDPWGVTHRAGYRRTLDSLMATRLMGRAPESVLRTRLGLVRRLKRAPTRQEWADGVTGALVQRGASAADLAEAEEWLRRVVDCEDRFRAEGFLAPDGRIDTLAAFDYGRAVNVVRLALGARYCDPAEAGQAVVRIGELARRAYGSWAEFSLGYGLARVIHYAGDEEAEITREESLAQHRILTQDPTSPYRNIPWS
ncbi:MULTISPECIES: DUF1266 domain-containing protein [unclassified Streptomyces]|uniref:DUF1266 domain-containing protein n=1 Tax=unclassified Streptomyces TaxID=2593676 RepID=UPI002E2B7127|nr:DUF1266 domain-containing protein [Streptomyces sp. NBC_01429]